MQEQEEEDARRSGVDVFSSALFFFSLLLCLKIFYRSVCESAKLEVTPT